MRSLRFVGWYSILVQLLLLTYAVQCSAQSNKYGTLPTISEVVKGVSEREAALRSTAMAYHRISQLDDSFADAHDVPAERRRTEIKGEYAYKGGKVYHYQIQSTAEQANVKPAPGERISTGNGSTLTIYDGTRAHHFEPGAIDQLGRNMYDSVATVSDFRTESPLDFGTFVSGKLLSSIFRSGTCTVETIEHDAKAGLLIVVRAETKPGLTVHARIAPKYGFIGLNTLLEFRQPGSNQVSAISYECENIKNVGGVWIALGGKYTGYELRDGERYLQQSAKLTVDKCSVNDVPDSRFDTSMPTGAVVSNKDNGKRYHVGINHELVPEDGSVSVSGAVSSKNRLPYIFAACIFALGIGLIMWHHRNNSR